MTKWLGFGLRLTFNRTESFLSQNESEIVSICKDSDSSIVSY